jgi:hypothetical protein
VEPLLRRYGLRAEPDEDNPEARALAHENARAARARAQDPAPHPASTLTAPTLF